MNNQGINFKISATAELQGLKATEAELIRTIAAGLPLPRKDTCPQTPGVRSLAFSFSSDLSPAGAFMVSTEKTLAAPGRPLGFAMMSASSQPQCVLLVEEDKVT